MQFFRISNATLQQYYLLLGYIKKIKTISKLVVCTDPRGALKNIIASLALQLVNQSYLSGLKFTTILRFLYISSYEIFSGGKIRFF